MFEKIPFRIGQKKQVPDISTDQNQPPIPVITKVEKAKSKERAHWAISKWILIASIAFISITGCGTNKNLGKSNVPISTTSPVLPEVDSRSSAAAMTTMQSQAHKNGVITQEQKNAIAAVAFETNNPLPTENSQVYDQEKAEYIRIYTQTVDQVYQQGIQSNAHQVRYATVKTGKIVLEKLEQASKTEKGARDLSLPSKIVNTRTQNYKLESYLATQVKKAPQI